MRATRGVVIGGALLVLVGVMSTPKSLFGHDHQRAWLIRWLTGKEAPLYAKGYRWDLSEGAMKHPVASEADANAIADYFEKNHKDPRVNVGTFDVSKVSKFDVTFGGMAYKAHTCGSGSVSSCVMPAKLVPACFKRGAGIHSPVKTHR